MMSLSSSPTARASFDSYEAVDLDTVNNCSDYADQEKQGDEEAAAATVRGEGRSSDGQDLRWPSSRQELWQTLLLLKYLAWSDIRVYDWPRLAESLLVVTWIGALFGIWLYLGIHGSYFYRNDTSVCKFDGSFNIYDSSYNIWRIDGFFEITFPVAFDLLFTDAKVVDIAWDIVLGRGVQITISWVSWIAISRYIAVCIVDRPITFSTFFVFFLESEPTVWSMWDVTCDFVRRRRLRSAWAMAAILYIFGFVLLWSTLASAMTGYVPVTEGYAGVEPGRKIMFEVRDLKPIAYRIFDGPRVGLEKDRPIFLDENIPDAYGDPLVSLYDPMLDTPCDDGYFNVETGLWEDKYNLGLTPEHLQETNPRCYLRRQASIYVGEYGSRGEREINSTFNGIELEPPTLKIEIDYLSPEGDLNVSSPKDYWNRKFMTYRRLDDSGDTWNYWADSLTMSGACNPPGPGTGEVPKYQWGFSFLQLYINLALLLMWSLATATLWLKARLQLPLVSPSYPEVPRGLSAVLSLAGAIQHDLVVDGGIETDGKTGSELAGEANRKRRGGAVAFHDAELASTEARFGVRLKRAVWKRGREDCTWWLAVAAASGFVVLAIMATDLSADGPNPAGLTFTVGVLLGLVLAVVAGRSLMSRLFIAGGVTTTGLLITLLVVLPWQQVTGYGA